MQKCKAKQRGHLASASTEAQALRLLAVPAPGYQVSSCKVFSWRTRRSSSRAVALLRLAVTTVGWSDTALGAFYRRLASRMGKLKALSDRPQDRSLRPSGTACPAEILVRITMSSNIAAVSSLPFSAEPKLAASSYRQFQATPIRLFLRKSIAIFSGTRT